MIHIGPTLAAAREARGLALREAELLTCMRRRYLVALEGDRFDELPGRTYARAFLRTYASALGLDANLLVAEFDEQVPEPVELDPLPLARRRRGVPLAAAPVAAAVGLVVALVWSAWSNDHLTQSPIAAPPPPPPAAAAAVVHHVRAARRTVRHATVAAVTAVAGPCWVEARRGSATGPLLAERTLARGETLRLGTGRVWLRLGAPWNARVRRGVVPRPLAPTRRPVDLLL